MVTDVATRHDRRDQVMRAAVAVIATEGASQARLNDIATRAGMSLGHVMYYFGTRDNLLMEALVWSERQALAQISNTLAKKQRSPTRQLVLFVELYLPQDRKDPRWSLWFQLSAVWPKPTAGIDALLAANRSWQALFIELLQNSEFGEDAADLAEWFLPYLDGLALDFVTTPPNTTIVAVQRAITRLERAINQESP